MSSNFDRFLRKAGLYSCPFSKETRVLNNDTWNENYSNEIWKIFGDFSLSDMGRISFNGKIKKIHNNKIIRTAYFLFTGIKDDNLFIEHINGVETDNRISNLRLVEKFCERFVINGYDDNGVEKCSYTIENIIAELGMNIINFINKPIKFMNLYWIRKMQKIDDEPKLSSFKIDGLNVRIDFEKKIVLYPNSMVCVGSDKFVINHKTYDINDFQGGLHILSKVCSLELIPMMRIVNNENNEEIKTRCIDEIIKFTGINRVGIIRIIMNGEKHDKFTFIKNGKRKIDE